jgi:hypothetical protein
MLGWVGIIIILLPTMLVSAIVRTKLSPEGALNKLDAHLKDFPGAVIGLR